MTAERSDSERIGTLAKQSTPMALVVLCGVCGVFLLFLPVIRNSSDPLSMTPAVGALVLLTGYMHLERRLRIEPLLREVQRLRADMLQLGSESARDI